jgi:hypothetical protein
MGEGGGGRGGGASAGCIRTHNMSESCCKRMGFCLMSACLQSSTFLEHKMSSSSLMLPWILQTPDTCITRNARPQLKSTLN